MNTLALAVASALLAAPADSPPLTIRLEAHAPTEQWERVLRLFDGLDTPHPAALLARWKQPDPSRSLGKGTDALLASFNPLMAPELRRLDGATLTFQDANGLPAWWARFPSDDGVLADALASQSLTEGRRESAITVAGASRSVDRLSNDGPALYSHEGPLVVLANSRDGLLQALSRPTSVEVPAESCLRLFIQAGEAGSAWPLEIRRASAALQAAHARECDATASLDPNGQGVRLSIHGLLKPPIAAFGRVRPAWLAWIPDDADAALSLSLGDDPRGLDRLFAVADAVEKSDPALARTAPLRVRLSLFASAASVQLDRDLLSRVAGVTAWFRQGDPGHAVLILHSRNEADAAILADLALPRLADRYAAAADEPRSWRLAGRPVRLARAGADVLISVGLEAGATPPERSAAGWLLNGLDDPALNRLGFARLNALARYLDLGTPAEDAPGRVIWRGGTTGDAWTDEVICPDLGPWIRSLSVGLGARPNETHRKDD